MDDPVSLRARDDDRWQRLVGQPTAAPAAAVTPPSPHLPPPCPAAADAAQPVDASLGRCPVQVTGKRVEPAMQRDAQDVEMQGRLDAFREAMTGTYRTVDGKQLTVAAPFQMTTPYKNQVDFLGDKTAHHAEDLGAAVHRAQLSPEAFARVTVGRGTPDEIHALTQALLDAQPAGSIETSADLRQLLFNNRVGVDCASYVQQAYLSVTRQTRAQAGLVPMMNESLTNLANRGFQRVTAVSDLRPGDIVALRPPKGDTVGHRAIVYDQRSPTSDEMRALLQSHSSTKIDFVVGGPVRVVEVDSSWGCGRMATQRAADGTTHDVLVGDANAGGVKRVTWLYNESSKQWASWDRQTGSFWTSDTPYDHPVDGFFRKER